MKAHWNKIYSKKQENQLGWYEDFPDPSLKLISQCKLKKESNILIVGAGASTLIDELLSRGFTHLIANDISSAALERLQTRIGIDKSKQLKWIIDDLTNPVILPTIGTIDLWYDRAVLHFFINQKEQDAYFSLLKSLTGMDSYVIIASFSVNGADKCSGLPVHRYNVQMLESRLLPEFELLNNFNHTHKMPDGQDRPYIYSLFQRKLV